MKNQIFNNYVKKYNLKIVELMRKFHHTYRVVEFCEEIAKEENMNEKEIFLAKTIGLLHDIGRFEQFTQYKTFIDHNSIDHGDLAYEILVKDNFIYEFVKTEEEALIVLKAVKNHNKKEIIGEYTDKELKFINLIRDADKLDIIKEQYNQIKSENICLNNELFDSIYSEKLMDNKLVVNDVGGIFRALSFIFDLNYKYSFKFILNKKIIENKINLLETYVSNVHLEELNKLKKFLFNYIEKRIANVR